jgi:hypothetical protein
VTTVLIVKSSVRRRADFNNEYPHLRRPKLNAGQNLTYFLIESCRFAAFGCGLFAANFWFICFNGAEQRYIYPAVILSAMCIILAAAHILGRKQSQTIKTLNKSFRARSSAENYKLRRVSAYQAGQTAAFRPFLKIFTAVISAAAIISLVLYIAGLQRNIVITVFLIASSCTFAVSVFRKPEYLDDDKYDLSKYDKIYDDDNDD